MLPRSPWVGLATLAAGSSDKAGGLSAQCAVASAAEGPHARATTFPGHSHPVTDRLKQGLTASELRSNVGQLGQAVPSRETLLGAAEHLTPFA